MGHPGDTPGTPRGHLRDMPGHPRGGACQGHLIPQGCFGENRQAPGVLVSCECGLLLFSSTWAHLPRASQVLRTPSPQHPPKHPSFPSTIPPLSGEHKTVAFPSQTGLHQFKTDGEPVGENIRWVCFRETDFDAVYFYEGEEKGENRYFYFSTLERKHRLVSRVCPTHRQLFQPPCSCLTHTVVVAAITCCLFICSGRVLCCFLTDFSLKPHSTDFL